MPMMRAGVSLAMRTASHSGMSASVTAVRIRRSIVATLPLVIVVLIFVCTGHFPDLYWRQIFFYMFLMVVFWIAWGLFASMLSAMSNDFLNLVKSISTAIFWLSGIMWDVNKIHIPWLQHLLYFNPVTYIATGYRNCFIYKVWFWEEARQLGIFIFLLLIMIILAIWAYRKLIKEIPDVL